jgi:hypothetical protein
MDGEQMITDEKEAVKVGYGVGDGFREDCMGAFYHYRRRRNYFLKRDVHGGHSIRDTPFVSNDFLHCVTKKYLKLPMID